MARLALERKNLVDNVKKLDEAMLALRAVAGTSPAVAQTIPNVLQRLAGVRKSVGVDGPQQLHGLHRAAGRDRPAAARRPGAVAAAAGAVPGRRRGRAPAPPPAGAGLPKAVADAEVAARPRPAAEDRRDAPADGPAGRLGGRQVGREAPRDVQRREPLREDRRPGRELRRLQGQGDGLRLLPPRRRRVERGPGLHLRDGRHAQGPGQVRHREARRGQAAARRGRGVHDGREHAVLLGPVLHPDRLDEGRREVRRVRARPWPGGSPTRRSPAGRRRPSPRPPARATPGRRRSRPEPRPAPPRPRRRDARGAVRPAPGGLGQGQPDVRRQRRLRVFVPVRRLPRRLLRGGRELEGVLPALRHPRGGEGGLREVPRQRQAGRGRGQGGQGRGGRPDGRRVEHRPRRRPLPQGQHPRRRRGLDRRRSPPRSSPAPSPRPSPPGSAAVAAAESKIDTGPETSRRERRVHPPAAPTSDRLPGPDPRGPADE